MFRPPFFDRRDAGQALARSLTRYAFRPDVIVLALPRGGVPVGYEVAQALRAPVDALLVRKLGVPGHEELAMGAIASGGVRVLNQPLIEQIGINNDTIEQVTAREREVLQARELTYRGNRPPPTVRDRCAILIDDGLATGATMLAAVDAVQQQHPRCVVVAAPVAPPDMHDRLANRADDVVFVMTPHDFAGVGQWYENFEPTSDQQVRELLARAAPAVGQADPKASPTRR
ncbi:phosphoribosyltransferase [Phycisphaerales bacterium AB-hyl4]|uniref:Phosphoribosyltransferase n=1 Tax=Natronomicrosphaera hydrolytica TaxID=3242702 RepID=A0ABV4U1J0_9BACT